MPGLRTFYLSLVSLFGSGTLMITCMDRFQASKYTPMRAFLFSCLGGCGVFPIFHQVGGVLTTRTPPTLNLLLLLPLLLLLLLLSASV